MATFEHLAPSLGTRAGNTIQNSEIENGGDMEDVRQQNRTLTLKIRISPQEKERMLVFVGKTTEKKLGTYLRKLGLQKPVTVRYRNESADDFLREMIELKKQLNGIGNNFNQAVHKLHTLDRVPQFREWILEQQLLHRQIVQSIEAIRLRINLLYDKWSQE